MKARKLCGYDLNGWRDRAARNWSRAPGEEEEIGASQVGAAVLRPCVVQVGAGRTARWIGGAQADLAPHGLGPGWGVVGLPERRRAVLDLLGEDQAPPERLAAALTGLAHGARAAAVAIEDRPEVSERLQERLIAAMAMGRIGRGLLVWRPVLTVLGALTEAADPLRARAGLRVGVINQSGEGFSVQDLVLRQEPGRAGFAPERRHAARILPSRLGYRGLIESARAALATAPGLRGLEQAVGSGFDGTRALSLLALEGAAEPELLRDGRGDFRILAPPSEVAPPVSDLEPGLFRSLAACDLVLLESQTRGSARTALAAAVARSLGRPLRLTPEEGVARGALEAARRFSLGETVYFDFLPQISTIVLGRDGAANVDLIGADEVLPAGRVYRSPAPARFAIQSGQSEFSVHLRKDLAPWPRKARVEIGGAAPSAIPLEMRVEQSPAAGRAKIVMDAPSLGRQFIVDWESAEEIQRPWADLIAELEGAPPTIPARLVLRCGAEDWDGPRGFSALLRESDGAAQVDWSALAARLAGRPKNRHYISSDGELSPHASQEDRARLDRLTGRAMTHVQDRVARRVWANNDSLRFLTWQFRRAPSELVDLLLEALRARAALRPHPLWDQAGSWLTIPQGLGRVCRTPAQERAALDALFLRPPEVWSYQTDTAAAAFLLSRSESAPLLLERPDVERLGRRVLIEFGEAVSSDYTKFNYAPFLLVGLLRWRLKEPQALVTGRDPLADAMRKAVSLALADLRRPSPRNERLDRAAERYEPLLRQILEELDGDGGNPDLLMDLYAF